MGDEENLADGASFPPSVGPAFIQCIPGPKGHKVPKDDPAVRKVGQVVPVSDVVPVDIGISFWLVPYKTVH